MSISYLFIHNYYIFNMIILIMIHTNSIIYNKYTAVNNNNNNNNNNNLVHATINKLILFFTQR